MKTRNTTKDGDYRSLLILDEISKNEELTQLELSKRLDIAVGLVNSYIKNLANKGYITISTIPKRRYLYYLTPKGFVAQSRLTYQHLQNFTNLYRVARRDFSTLFEKVNEAGITNVAFCGIDEIADIAYLSLSEVGIELSAIIDDNNKEKKFFNNKVVTIKEALDYNLDLVVITSFKNGETLTRELVKSGFPSEKIVDISRDGWLKRLAESI
ncbi:MAG: winged helix-turn-helix transcriptional regulator [Proteobacteria bacterium]|nr:winged helix-turn-helix transcriptional regulator [Pseudomonadota bacterium]